MHYFARRLPQSRSKTFFRNSSSRYHQQHHISTTGPSSRTELPHRPTTMPPKQRIVVQRAEPASYQSKGILRSTYDTVTSAENAPVVRSILAFGVRRPRYLVRLSVDLHLCHRPPSPYFRAHGRRCSSLRTSNPPRTLRQPRKVHANSSLQAINYEAGAGCYLKRIFGKRVR